jgi:hypothetical protein
MHGYGLKEVDLHISRTLKLRERLRLEASAESGNLFSTINVSCTARGCAGTVVAACNAPDLLRITSTFNSRQIQLGGRLRF